jgi:transposase
MRQVKGRAATLQVEMVCLDELVPEDDRYRKLDCLVDWSFVRELAGPYYAEDVGRPSIDPIVLVKLMVAGALEGIGSTRELLREAGMRLDLRRFLGYGLGERLPVHQTLSHAHTRRFVDAALFERLFLGSLELCKQHGLVEETHISIDGFHTEADAALASLRASLAVAAVPEADPDDRAEGSRRRRTPTISPRSTRAPTRSPTSVRRLRWRSRARGQRRSGEARIAPLSLLPTRRRSCAASRVSVPIWSSAVRWRSTANTG